VPTSILVKRGLKIGKNFQRMSHVIIDDSHCWLIEIGDNVTLAPRVHILAHDASTKMFIGYTKIGCVIIENNVFIGADCIILPGVRIGSNVVIGSGSIVTTDLESNYVYAGNPCQKIDTIENFISKHKKNINEKSVFGEEYILKNINQIKKEEMKKLIRENGGYIV